MKNNPYVGPTSFTVAQKDRFFGREREAGELTSLVVTERLVLFYAQSGAGKTSLINARLLPMLADRGFVTLPVGRVGGELPRAFKGAANIFVFSLLASLDKSYTDAWTLGEMRLADYLARLSSRDDGTIFYDAASAPLEDPTQAPPHVLVVDQFEELFTTNAHRWHERRGFFEQLDEALAKDPLLWVMLSLREDFISALDPFAGQMAGGLRARYFMQRMERPAALEAIRGPAKWAGHSFEHRAAEVLADSLSQVRIPGTANEYTSGQYIDPVQLQIVCHKLWESLPEGKRKGSPITERNVRRLGNINRAFAGFYEDTLDRVLAAHPQVSEVHLRRWFEKNLITEIGGRGAIAEGDEQTGGIANPVVRAMVKQFLLRAEQRASGNWYELTHDRFVRPVLESNRLWWEAFEARRAARDWDDNRRPEKDLLRGARLQEALAAPLEVRQDPLVTEFLSRSVVYDAQESDREDRQRKRDLGETGWGVIFAADADPAVRQALSELLNRRRQQAGYPNPAYYREFTGPKGYRPVEQATAFLKRHGAGLDDINPERMPEYLLIVGSPEQIPFTFQYQLDVKYAVGRIYFETLREYAQYARSVVSAEAARPPLPRRVTLFAPTHPDDPATNRSSELLVKPLDDILRRNHADWEVTLIGGTDANRRRLQAVLGGEETPAVLFVASHSMRYKPGDPLQRHVQGALVCADWQGPRAGGRLTQEHFLGYIDLDNERDLFGTLGFFFVSDSAGVPKHSDFPTTPEQLEKPPALAPGPFISRLAQRLLGHPNGGMLALIGHVDLTWLYSIIEGRGRSASLWPDTFKRLLDGYPVGRVLDFMNQRHIEMAAAYAALEQQRRAGEKVEPYAVIEAIQMMNDARNFIVLGDPAVWTAPATGAAQPPAPPRRIQPVEAAPGMLFRPSAVRSLAWAPDGQRLAVACGDGTVSVWALTTGESTPLFSAAPVLTLGAHTDQVNAVDWSRDGRWLLTASSDRTAGLWDAASGARLATLSGHTAPVADAAFSPDGSLAATGGRDGQVIVWSLPFGQVVRTLQAHTAGINSVEFSPDGTRLLTASADKTARLWDAADGSQQWVVVGHEDYVSSAVFTEDGKEVITVGFDGKTLCWKAETGEQGQALEASSERLVAAAVHPTLPLVVTASASGEVRCMLPTRPTLVYTGLTAAVWAVALSPDGRWLATGGDDGCVALRPGNAPADRDPTTLELLREQGFDAAVKRARERSAPETKAPDGV